MEWLVGEGSVFPEEDMSRGARSSAPLHQQPSAESMASLCHSQQQRVKASIVSGWRLAEAQDQLCGLELHGSESAEQEHARAQAGSAELVQTEREWRHKESMLGGGDLSRSPVLGPHRSRDVFNKSIINVQSRTVEVENDRSKTFVQKYDQHLRHFGMLRRWDDSQHFLSDHSHIICEETANFLILWCFRLQAEEVGSRRSAGRITAYARLCCSSHTVVMSPGSLVTVVTHCPRTSGSEERSQHVMTKCLFDLVLFGSVSFFG